MRRAGMRNWLVGYVTAFGFPIQRWVPPTLALLLAWAIFARWLSR